MKKPKVVIIGAGIGGLACARCLEKQGIIPVILERQSQLGWMWPSASVDLEIFTRVLGKDLRKYLRENLAVDVKPLAQLRHITLKSANKQVEIQGNLGYIFRRGNDKTSISSQLFADLVQTPVYMNSFVEYEQLTKEYDFVVIANGADTAARKLGVWESKGKVYICKALVNGNFETGSSKVYFNTEYAGTGYARLTPLNNFQALLCIYVMGNYYTENDLPRLFKKFLHIEQLDRLKIIYKINPMPFSTGRVSQYRIGNILLVGRAAGLTERVMGVGFASAIASGVYAVKAIVEGKDYDQMLKPLKTAIEDVSAFRPVLNTFDNNAFDRLLMVIDTPVIKHAIYHMDINLIDKFGKLLKLTVNQLQRKKP